MLLQRKPRSRRKLAFLSATLLILLSNCFYYIVSTNSDLKYYLTVVATTTTAVTSSGSERSGSDNLAIQNNSTAIIDAVDEGTNESRNRNSTRMYSAKQVIEQLRSNETSNHSAAAAVADDHTQHLHYHDNHNTSNNNNNNTTAANYKEEVTFIPTFNMPSNFGDIYSGMWYQSISLMMTTNYTTVTDLEGVTFQSFHASKRYHGMLEKGEMALHQQTYYHPLILMTQDWLDFSVEHLSKYVRHFSEGKRAGVDLDEYNVGRVKQRVVQSLHGYVENSLMSMKRSRVEMEELVENDDDDSDNNRMETAVVTAAKTALQHTIAIIPIRVGGIIRRRTVDGILSTLQTTATIVSLCKCHFPRIVIAGVTQDEHEAYQDMMDMLQGHMELISTCEIVYVHMEGDESEWTNVPKMAMMEFQRAIRESRRSWKNDTVMTTAATTTTATTAQRRNNSSGSSNIVQSWLGANPNRWRHIYFTEPDLILHTRLMALPSLIRQLDKGRILTAHRLQPLPHIQQFVDFVEGNTTTTTQQAAQSHNSTNNTGMNSSESKLVTYFNENALPNHGPFHTDTIQHLNPHNTSCCDQGNYFPANTNNPNEPVRPRKHHGCPGTYELCGFRNKRWGYDYSNWTHMERAHQFLINYTLIAFEVGYGTGLPLVHAHQRVCGVQREACS